MNVNHYCKEYSKHIERYEFYDWLKVGLSPVEIKQIEEAINHNFPASIIGAFRLIGAYFFHLFIRGGGGLSK